MILIRIYIKKLTNFLFLSLLLYYVLSKNIKLMKKIIFLLLLLSFIILESCNSNENDVLLQQKNNLENSFKENKVYYDNEGMNILQNSFKEDTIFTRSNSICKRKKYPNYYGGSYIDKDQTTVVIILVGKFFNKYQDEFKKIMGSWPVRFEVGKFSYNELNNIHDKFYQFLVDSKNKEIVKNIVACGTYDDKNLISISLEDCSESKIKEIKEKFLDSEAIIFEKSDRPIDLASLNPGGKIRFYETSRTATIGYRAKSTLDNKAGFVTTGHYIKTGDHVYKDNSLLGTARLVKNKDNIDASFIQLDNSSFVLSNVTNSGITLSPIVSDVAVGNTINVEGAEKGRAFARVSQTNVTTNIGGQAFYDLIKIDIQGLQEGDSGGILYNNTSFRIIGILKSATSTYAHAVKAKNINDTFRLTTY